MTEISVSQETGDDLDCIHEVITCESLNVLLLLSSFKPFNSFCEMSRARPISFQSALISAKSESAFLRLGISFEVSRKNGPLLMND